MPIKDSELILNPDGSVYHLNLKPDHVSDTIIFVGDLDRVEKSLDISTVLSFNSKERV
jgi:uridine phosphorylase